MHLCSLCVSGWVTVSPCTRLYLLRPADLAGSLFQKNSAESLFQRLLVFAVGKMAFQASRKSLLLGSAKVLLEGRGMESLKEVKLHFEHVWTLNKNLIMFL